MNIELRPLADIKPYERNPRDNDAAVDAVAESIRRFGFRQPVVVDGDGVIVCGHTRWKAAQKLGLEKVPVHMATDLTPQQVRAYRIADNKTNELAAWNMELLPLELAELQGAGTRCPSMVAPIARVHDATFLEEYQGEDQAGAVWPSRRRCFDVLLVSLPGE